MTRTCSFTAVAPPCATRAPRPIRLSPAHVASMLLMSAALLALAANALAQTVPAPAAPPAAPPRAPGAAPAPTPSVAPAAPRAPAESSVPAGALPLPPRRPAAAAASAPSRGGYAESVAPMRTRTRAVDPGPYAPIGTTPPGEEAPLAELEMYVGESRVFPAPGVARIAVGNGNVMTAEALDKRDVILFANGVGSSTLFLWHEDGRYQRVKVNVVGGDASRYAREIAQFLNAMPNVRTHVIGDKVVVDGEHLSKADTQKVAKLAERYPQIVNFSSDEGWGPMVLMDVKVVEFPVRELREIGVRWNSVGGAAIGGIWSPIRRGNDGPYQIDIRTGQENPPPITNPNGGGVVLPSGLNILSAINLGLNAQLNLLQQEGKTTILAEPQLSTRSGTSARFLAGGEYPYSVTSRDGTTVVFKPYGIRLNITPRVDERNGAIRARIETEVSQIDQSVSTPFGPGLLSRQTDTEFNVITGETIVLSGLIRRELGTSYDKLPLLGDIPVLGALFRSKRFQNDETELVVFVTPVVVDAQTPGQVDRIERTNEKLRQNLGEPPHVTDPVQPGRDPGRPTSRAPASATPQAAAPAAPVAAAATASAPALPATAMDAASAPGAPTPAPLALRVLRDGLVLRERPQPDGAPVMHLLEGDLVLPRSAEAADGRWQPVVAGASSGWVPSDGVEWHRRPPVAPGAAVR